MAKERKTKGELAQMIAERLGQSNVTINVVSDESSSWQASAFVRGPDGDVAMRVQQIAQDLRALYDLKKN